MTTLAFILNVVCWGVASGAMASVARGALSTCWAWVIQILCFTGIFSAGFLFGKA